MWQLSQAAQETYAYDIYGRYIEPEYWIMFYHQLIFYILHELLIRS